MTKPTTSYDAGAGRVGDFLAAKPPWLCGAGQAMWGLVSTSNLDSLLSFLGTG